MTQGLWAWWGRASQTPCGGLKYVLDLASVVFSHKPCFYLHFHTHIKFKALHISNIVDHKCKYTLRLLDTYATKIAKIWVLWTFWPETWLINHILAELQARMSRVRRFLLFLHHKFYHDTKIKARYTSTVYANMVITKPHIGKKISCISLPTDHEENPV